MSQRKNNEKNVLVKILDEIEEIDIEDEQFKWEYENDENNLIQFDHKYENKLENAYKKDQKGVLKYNVFGNTYICYFDEMKQINEETKKERKIKRSKKLKDEKKDAIEFERSTDFIWQWKDTNGYNEFPFYLVLKFEREFEKNPSGHFIYEIHHSKYNVSFKDMTQVNLDTNKKREIKRIKENEEDLEGSDSQSDISDYHDEVIIWQWQNDFEIWNTFSKKKIQKN